MKTGFRRKSSKIIQTQFVFKRKTKTGGSNDRAEIPMDTSMGNNKGSEHVQTGTELSHVNVTNDSSQRLSRQTPEQGLGGVMNDASISQSEFLPNHTGLTLDDDVAATSKADPPASPSDPKCPRRHPAVCHSPRMTTLTFLNSCTRLGKSGVSLKSFGVSPGIPQETASKPDNPNTSTFTCMIRRMMIPRRDP